MTGGPNEFTNGPELRKPVPFQLCEATTLKWIPVVKAGLPPCGSPGPPAGTTAFAFRCTVPSGATRRMSLLVVFELNVIVCGPTSHQVTEPPTGILYTFGPNSVISAGAFCAPEPARTLPGGS